LNSCLHNLHHLLDDQSLVGVLGIASGLDLLLCSLGESNAEKSEDEPIGGLGLNVSLDKGVPFLDHGACLISGDVHTVEVGVAIKSLNFVDLESHCSPGLGLGLIVAISEGNVINTTSQTVRGLLLTGGLVARRQSDASLIKSWGEDVVPFLLHEWMGAIHRVNGKTWHNRIRSV
jgi:hypothetical protein